jgi:hypothetical protein
VARGLDQSARDQRFATNAWSDPVAQRLAEQGIRPI